MSKTELFVRRQKGGMFTVVNEAMTTGDIYWVNSGAGNQGGDTAGYGQNPDAPFLTLAYAITQCTAFNGDMIFLMPGHAETIVAAGGIDLDVAGVKIVGLGEGRNRPTFGFEDDVDASIEVNATSVTVENVIFDMTGIDDLVAGIDVIASDFTLRNFEIAMTVVARQAEIAVNIGNAAHRATFENFVISAPDVGANDGINIGAAAGIVDGVKIVNGVIRGAFTNAPVYAAAAAEVTSIIVENNTLVNASAGNYAIEFDGTVAGQIINNKLVTDDIATALEPDGCACFGNYFLDSVGLENATPIPTDATTGGATLAEIQSVTDALPNDGALTDITAVTDTLAGRVRHLAIKPFADLSSGWATTDVPDVFTVTGDVLVRCFGTVQTGVTSDSNDGTIELGVEGNTAVLIPQTVANGTRLDAGDVWIDTDSDEKCLAAGNADWFIIAGGANIIANIATNNMTAGAITIYCEWLPLSGNGNVTPA